MKDSMNGRTTRRIALLGALSTTVMAAHGADVPQADAEERTGLEEVVVTAEHRETSLQDTPLSVTALSGRQLEAQGLTSLESWSDAVPGLTYSEIDAGERTGGNLVIRGISNTRFFDGSTASMTSAMYLDDVSIRPVDPNLFDVERIEVLRGPQGTLFGQASMGGTVRLISNKPNTREFSARAHTSLSFTQGGSESYSGDLMLNVPVIEDMLAFRTAVSHRHDGGWVDLQYSPLETGIRKSDPAVTQRVAGHFAEGYDVIDANSGETWSARVSALFKPTESITITPAYLWQTKRSDVQDAYDRQLDDGYLLYAFHKTPREVDFSVASLTGEYATTAGTLTLMAGQSNRDYLATQDTTYSCAVDVGFNLDGGIPDYCLLDFRGRQRTDNYEARFNGLFDVGSAVKVNWVLGASYLEEKSQAGINWGSARWNSNVDNNNYIRNPDGFYVRLGPGLGYYENFSVFGDVQVRFGRFGIAGGLRHFKHEVGALRATYSEGSALGSTLTSPNGVFSQPGRPSKQSGKTPRANVSFDFTDAVMAYVTYSEGFRMGYGGGPQPAVYRTPACQEALIRSGLGADFNGKVDSDTVKNYELGLKGRFLDDRLQINGTVYRIDWTDLQKSLELTRYSANCSLSVDANIGASQIDGVEIETTALVGSHVTIGGTLAYTDARMTEAPPGTSFKVGDPMGGVPEWTGSAYFDYTRPMPQNFKGNLRIDYFYRGSMIGPNFIDANDPTVRNGSYSMINLHLGVSRGDWGSLRLFANNLTDAVGELGAATLFGEPFTTRVMVRRPREVGLEYSVDF